MNKDNRNSISRVDGWIGNKIIHLCDCIDSSKRNHPMRSILLGLDIGFITGSDSMVDDYFTTYLTN